MQVFVLKFATMNLTGLPFVSDLAIHECFTLKELYIKSLRQVSFREDQLTEFANTTCLERFIIAVHK